MAEANPKMNGGDARALFCSVERETAERGLADVLAGVLGVPVSRSGLWRKRAPLLMERYWEKLRKCLGRTLPERQGFAAVFLALGERKAREEGAGGAAGAREVLLRLCAEAAGNELPDLLDAVQGGRIFPDETGAACASGRALLRRTERNNDEYLCVIYKTGRLAVDRNGRLCYGEGYTYTPPQKGRHSSVFWPVIRAIAAGMAGRYKNDANPAGKFSLNHSHPNCERHIGDQFSGSGVGKDRFGDRDVTRGRFGAQAVYLTAPATGRVYRYGAGMDMKAVNGAIRKDPAAAAVGNAGYRISRRACSNGRQ